MEPRLIESGSSDETREVSVRRAHWLGRLALFTVASPRMTLTAGLALAIVSVIFMASRLELHTSRDDLIHPESAFHQRWERYTAEFPKDSDIVIVVEGPDPQSVTTAVDLLVERLEATPEHFRDILGKLDFGAIRRKGLFFQSVDELRQLASWVGPATRCLQQPNTPRETYAELWSAMEARLQQSSPDAERGSAPLEYLFVRADTMAIVTARLNQDDRIQFVPDPAPLEALEQHCAEVRDKVPHVSLGLTGLPILEFAEMKTSERDMTWASVFSLLGVSLLFWAGFGGWRYPMLGIAALLIGIAWTCGYLTLAVGHLNILSMSFGVILIGLGIDFAIHYVARYQHEAAHRSAATLGDTAHLRHVLDATAAHVGPPLLAGGITTSLAFFATAATEFRGVAELGLIAGGGVLICTAATLLMMPSLIWITNSWHGHLRQPTALLPIHRLLRPLWDHPRTITLVSLTVTLLLAVGATRVKFDHNLLKLQAENLESVQWERRLLTQTDRSTWFAVSLAIDPSEARSRRAAFERLPSVSRVEEIASLMPTDISEKQPWIQQIADDLAAVSDAPPSVQPLSDESFATDSLSQFAHQRVPTLPLRAGGESDRSPTEQVNVSRATLATKIWHHLRQLRATANPTPPTMEDIPAELRTRFLGRSGTHLLRVFAAGNPWESDTLAEFVRDIESVDAQITGHPVQAFYASRQMERSYYRAAVISAVLVGFVLYLDLRHIGLSLLAAIPTCAGMVQMFGLMGWLGIPLNPANVIVLPLVIGIGIDDGIHVMHAFRAGWAIGDRGQGSLGASTTNGIVLTSLTSMIGFGSLMLANHQGLQGLGRVVTLGIACCLAVSTITLPCLLSLLASRRNHDAPNQPIACNQNRLK